MSVPQCLEEAEQQAEASGDIPSPLQIVFSKPFCLFLFSLFSLFLNPFSDPFLNRLSSHFLNPLSSPFPHFLINSLSS